ncbi:MAG: HAD family hydrolase [Shimia sp.]
MINAILFGSIGTLVETSEIQRDAYNDVFAAHGLDWHWDTETYRPMLARTGGAARIARYAEARGEDVDAEALNEAKRDAFHARLARGGLAPRPGVRDVMRQAWDAGMRCGLATGVGRDTVTALLRATGDALTEADFDVIVTREMVEGAKPDPEAYFLALDELRLTPAQAVAVEDNRDGFQAAGRAGLACVAFPGANTRDHDFPGAFATAPETLDFQMMRLPEMAAAG